MTARIHFAASPDLRIYDGGKLVAVIPDNLLPALNHEIARRLLYLSSNPGKDECK